MVDIGENDMIVCVASKERASVWKKVDNNEHFVISLQDAGIDIG